MNLATSTKFHGALGLKQPECHFQVTMAAAQGMSSSAAQPEATPDAPKRGWGKLLMRGAVAATAGGVGFALMEDEAEHGLHSAQYPWSHNGWFSAYDHASIRRGHQVYQQVRIST